MTTVDMIRDFGLAVAEASNGVEALEILRTDDMIDVLLTDLGLPGMSGGELIEEALKLRPGLKVIIASGRYSARSEGVTAPNVTELPKPYTPADLRAALGA
jgi:CheY-like chemotaxis protein